ncbi:MAG: phage resistance protein [Gemmatimonadales bacterium]|nr:MAG: phage resistance protein [Gemmatimonadales bacterium]
MLLRDLIHIPEAVHHSDFVISLADGIDRPQETVDRYVVTEQLLDCFQRALSLVDSAVSGGVSRGAYLHGSFGSGKSHFMAILHLLLSGDPHARGRAEFQPLLERYDRRLEGKKILLVPYHMIGAHSMEAGVLGGYVRHIRRLHPEAALPAVYLDDALLAEARDLREKMGDELFFQNLGGAAEDDGFGALAGGWTAERFEAALQAGPDDAERATLVSDYIDAFARRTVGQAEGTGRGFVPFDQGLDAISRHARGLGYHGVLLFLDELILWFASRMGDPQFVNREGPKVAKLVEAPSAQRPAPIISFIARQRDLRDFIGSGVPGAQALNFGDILQWWEGRFDTIELSDTNLRAIVEQRLLRTRGDDARTELDLAFQRTFIGGSRAMDTLMTSEADQEAFRRVYPFSPALIDTLVAVSSYLQRERTALRLLLQLLVQRRDELEVGDLVPIGDLYDVIRSGEEPFSAELKRHFVRTRDLYEHRLRPLLLREHGLDEEGVRALPAKHPFRTDDRLIKTLLLAALVADAGPLRSLTVRRLANLNHGTIRSPIPGAERAAVLQRLRRWQPDVPELRLDGDEQDPTVALRIAGVDVQGILDQASAVDNPGARRAKVRRLVAEALDVELNSGLFTARYKWVWRGSRREVELQFANIRDTQDIPDPGFRAGEVPKVLLDFPFDEEPGRGPNDDLARVREIRGVEEPQPTLVWLPNFFTEEGLSRLGQLVILDHILTGDRLETYTGHLSPQDRMEARHSLASMRDAHRTQVQEALRQAYGIHTPPDERWVTAELDLGDQFQSMDPTLTLQPPAAAGLKAGLEGLLDQLFRHRYPAHPEFESEVTLGELRTCLTHVERAVAHRDQRVDIPREDRKAVRKILGPLDIADTGESHITLKRNWADHVHRMQAQEPGGPLTVERLKEWLDEPRPRGLSDRVANLVVCAFALADNRVLVNAGVQVAMDVARLDPQVELQSQRLPAPEDWERARPLAEAVFGLGTSPIRNASNVSTLVGQLKEQAGAYLEAVTGLVRELDAVPQAFRPHGEAPRRVAAETARDLLIRLDAADDVDTIGVLARVSSPPTAPVLGRTIKSAREVAGALNGVNWQLLQSAAGLGGEWAGRAQALSERVREAVAADPLAVELPAALRREVGHATGLLAQAATVKPVAPRPPAPDPTPGPTPTPDGATTPAPDPTPAPGPTPTPGPTPLPPVAPRVQTERLAGPDDLDRLVHKLRASGRRVEGIEVTITWRDD